jgi:hypothetical protein
VSLKGKVRGIGRSVGSTLPNGTWEAKVRRKDGRKGPTYQSKGKIQNISDKPKLT